MIDIVGVGTTFEVVLPAAVAGDGSLGRAALAEPASCRLLVIEDDQHVSDGLRRMLRGFEVVVVHSGDEALSLLRQQDQRFALVLCDLMMPGLSGADVFAALKAARPDIAASMVFMTGGTFTGAIKHFLSGVENVVLEKPFERADVMNLISQRWKEWLGHVGYDDTERSI